MSKKDNRTLQEKAKDYNDDLWDILEALKNGREAPAKHQECSLDDIYQMKKFYTMISGGRYKQAYGKLKYLAKECGLVPTDIWKDLDKRYNEYHNDEEWEF
jgi:hypothetical protein